MTLTKPPAKIVLTAFYAARAKQHKGEGSIQHENARKALEATSRGRSTGAEITETAEQIAQQALAAENAGTPITEIIQKIKAQEYTDFQQTSQHDAETQHSLTHP